MMDEEPVRRSAAQIAVQVVMAVGIVSLIGVMYLIWRPATVLTQLNHPTGWRKPTCLDADCHNPKRRHHNRESFRCVPCHGANGATPFSTETSGHAGAVKACLAGCHEVHAGEPAARFPDPESCTACHVAPAGP